MATKEVSTKEWAIRVSGKELSRQMGQLQRHLVDSRISNGEKCRNWEAGKGKGVWHTDQVEHVGHCKAFRFYSVWNGNLGKGRVTCSDSCLKYSLWLLN